MFVLKYDLFEFSILKLFLVFHNLFVLSDEKILSCNGIKLVKSRNDYSNWLLKMMFPNTIICEYTEDASSLTWSCQQERDEFLCQIISELI